MPYIYALRNRTTDLVYYGSTTLRLSVRLSLHRSRPSCMSRQITQCPTAYIELVEEVSEEDKLVRERWWIENNPCVNERRPFITPEEKAEYRLQYSREHSMERYLANREHRKAQMKEYIKRVRSRRRLLAREPPLDAL